MSAGAVPPSDHAPCPLCGRAADPQGPARPFCSPRCQLIDLGRWLKGEVRIPGDPVGHDPVERADDGAPGSAPPA